MAEYHIASRLPFAGWVRSPKRIYIIRIRNIDQPYIIYVSGLFERDRFSGNIIYIYIYIHPVLKIIKYKYLVNMYIYIYNH